VPFLQTAKRYEHGVMDVNRKIMSCGKKCVLGSR
jgi:hypothetical protein